MSSEQSIPSPATSDCGGAIAQAESPDDLAVQMNHLALSPQEQHQDEILSSPLLTAPLINKPPRSKFGLFGAPISEDSSYVAEARLFHNSIYSNIPHVKIEPLKLSDDDLNTRRMNDLMAVGEGSSKPLYMQVVNRI
ncbi:hypothetical protein COL940_013149 [Colletotrichum noveboracense]|nr:hypothetical protein COL940_013149 [Colletotrichum noveboracense]KAJ0272836.1 hypothetical protein CBS470a_012538 [Colletotrichum nupharicola]